MRLNERVIQSALDYVRAGLSVVPIRTDGSKKPPVFWTVWQSRLPSEYEIRQFFRNDVGVAIIGGVVSGNLEIIDFDRADRIDPWIALVEAKSPGLVARLSRIRTPKGGAHFYYRSETPVDGNAKLAQEPPSISAATGTPNPNTLIETRGEGGYVLAPGSPASCHPKNLTYDHVSGPEITQVSTITREERSVLLEAAKSFSTWTPVVVDRPTSSPISPGDRTRPGDDFNSRALWREILEPAGWKLVQMQGDVSHWKRPGKTDKGSSATVGHCGDCLHVFSPNAHPFDQGGTYTKFAAYTLIHHGGDYHASAAALEAMGYGDRASADREIEGFGKAVEEEKKNPTTAVEDPPPGIDLATPQKDYAKKKKPNRGDQEKYFKGKEFLPETLRRDVCDRHEFISTPVDKSGVGSTVYVYQDGCYRPNGFHVIKKTCHEILDIEAKSARFDNVVDLIRISHSTEYDNLNRQAKKLINLKNGMLDWESGKLLPHDSKYLSTFQINSKWDPSAKSEPLDKFLSEISSDHDIRFIEELMGYLMIPETSFHKSFAFVGMPGTGKSTLLKLIECWLGKENVSSVPLQVIEENKYATSGIFGKLANICTELNSSALEDAGMVKAIATGDTIEAEEKYHARFSFRPFCRLVFSANEFPHVVDRKGAFVSRMIFVEFENIFRNTKKEVKNYDEVLASRPETFPAMLNKAVTGLRRLMENGSFTQSEASKRLAIEYTRRCNSALFFFEENCKAGVEGQWLARKEFYQRYHQWARDHGLKPVSVHSCMEVIKSIRPPVTETLRDGYPGLKWVTWANGTPPTTTESEIEDFGKKDRNLDF